MIPARKHDDWPKRAGLGSVQFDLHCSPLFLSVLCGTWPRGKRATAHQSTQDHSDPEDADDSEEEGSIRVQVRSGLVFSGPASRLLTFFFFPSCSLRQVSFVFPSVTLSKRSSRLHSIYHYETLPPFRLVRKLRERTLCVISTSSTHPPFGLDRRLIKHSAPASRIQGCLVFEFLLPGRTLLLYPVLLLPRSTVACCSPCHFPDTSLISRRDPCERAVS